MDESLDLAAENIGAVRTVAPAIAAGMPRATGCASVSAARRDQCRQQLYGRGRFLQLPLFWDLPFHHIFSPLSSGVTPISTTTTVDNDTVLQWLRVDSVPVAHPIAATACDK